MRQWQFFFVKHNHTRVFSYNSSNGGWRTSAVSLIQSGTLARFTRPIDLLLLNKIYKWARGFHLARQAIVGVRKGLFLYFEKRWGNFTSRSSTNHGIRF